MAFTIVAQAQLDTGEMQWWGSGGEIPPGDLPLLYINTKRQQKGTAAVSPVVDVLQSGDGDCAVQATCDAYLGGVDGDFAGGRAALLQALNQPMAICTSESRSSGPVSPWRARSRSISFGAAPCQLPSIVPMVTRWPSV